MNYKKTLIKALVFILLCIAVGLLFTYLREKFELDQNWIDTDIRQHGIIGILYFVGLSALSMSCGLPRQLSAFLGGYAFGFVYGALLATLAATLGCIITFYFARLLAKPYILKRFPERTAKVNRFFGHHGFTKTIIIRLLPVGNNLLTNLIAGVTHIRMIKFVGGSCIGYIPQMAIFSLAGSGVTVMSFWKIFLSIVLFLISTLLSLYLYRQNYANDIRVAQG